MGCQVPRTLAVMDVLGLRDTMSIAPILHGTRRWCEATQPLDQSAAATAVPGAPCRYWAADALDLQPSFLQRAGGSLTGRAGSPSVPSPGRYVLRGYRG